MPSSTKLGVQPNDRRGQPEVPRYIKSSKDEKDDPGTLEPYLNIEDIRYAIKERYVKKLVELIRVTDPVCQWGIEEV